MLGNPDQDEWYEKESRYCPIWIRERRDSHVAELVPGFYAGDGLVREGAKARPPCWGFDPSEIMNYAITDVILPGFHFTGAHVDTGHV